MQFIAGQVYRHGPATMLYALPRTAIYPDPHGNGRFIVDQPSTCFSSFDNPNIAAVGVDLDNKVDQLLAAPGEFRTMREP